MPNVMQDGSIFYRFFAREGNEPAHIPAMQGRCRAKFWLNPVRFAKNDGFAPHELTRIRKFVVDHEAALLEAWNAVHP